MLVWHFATRCFISFPEKKSKKVFIKKFEKYFNHILVHTGQNYDYSLNEIFFDDLQVPKPDFYLEAADKNATQTIGQVLIKIKYSGICGSQIGEIEGIKGEDKYLPHLLGHEASGKVIEVGDGVTHVKKDDNVVLHWKKQKGSQF